MLPREFKPRLEYDLIRLGGDFDGGYLVDRKSIEKSKSLLTLGLGYEWRFEKEYFDLTKNPIICYDHTVTYSSVKKLCRKYLASYLFRIFKPKYFLKKNFFSYMIKNLFLFKSYKNFFTGKVIHEKKRVGSGKKELNLKDILENKNLVFPCFLKIDIEGSEYRILDEILKFQSNFTGIAIEFHDVDLHLDKILSFVSNLNQELVHIHPQNPAPVSKNDIPYQIEFTFSKNPIAISSNAKLPHKLDMPSNPDFEEIELKFQTNK